MKELLDVVGSALKNATSHQRTRKARAAESSASAIRRAEEEQQRRSRMMKGTWHDGRLDCVAGNGIMSELGFGDELLLPEDFDEVNPEVAIGGVHIETLNGGKPIDPCTGGTVKRNDMSSKEIEALETLPIVIIKNYATKRGRDDVLTVLAKWTASLVENQVRLALFNNSQIS